MNDNIKGENIQGHFAQEIEMAASDLYNAAKDAAELHRMVQKGDSLEPWQQSKVTKAADYLSTVLRSLEHDASMSCCNSSSEGEWCPEHGLEECGMYEAYSNLSEIKKGQKDGNGNTKCWPGKHAEGTKISRVTGKRVRNCVPNESVEEHFVGYQPVNSFVKGEKAYHGLIGPCVVHKVVNSSVEVFDKNGRKYRVSRDKLEKYDGQDLDEGSMGGINRPSELGLSHEHVLDDDSHYETNAEKQAEYRKARAIGKAAAKVISADKQAIEYEEKLTEFLHDDIDYNDDYVAEEDIHQALELDIMERGDNFDLELDNLIIESNIIGFLDDGVVIGLDEQALRFLKLSNVDLTEAKYHGKSVQLNKPTRGDVKKFKVYVKDPKTGNIKKVNFGDPNMRIKKSNPKRRKSFRARHHCENPGPKTKARYWSCRKW